MTPIEIVTAAARCQICHFEAAFEDIRGFAEIWVAAALKRHLMEAHGLVEAEESK